jgi:hypothetical protein
MSNSISELRPSPYHSFSRYNKQSEHWLYPIFEEVVLKFLLLALLRRKVLESNRVVRHACVIMRALCVCVCVIIMYIIIIDELTDSKLVTKVPKSVP